GKTTSRLNALMNGDMIWKIKFDNNEYVLDKHDMTLSTYIQKYRSHFVMKNYDAMASLPSAEFQKIFHDMTIISADFDMIQFVAKSSYWSNIDSKIKLNPTHTADNAENNKIEIKVTRPVSSLFLIKDLIKLTIFSQQQIKIFLSKKNLLIEFNSGGICNVRYYITPAEDDFTPYLQSTLGNEAEPDKDNFLEEVLEKEIELGKDNFSEKVLENEVELGEDNFSEVLENESNNLPSDWREVLDNSDDSDIEWETQGIEEIILVTHDECIFYSNDGKRGVWAKSGELPLKKKGNGRSMMVSEFLTEKNGRLHLNEEQITSNPYVPEESRVILKPGKNHEGR
ncbi:18009_t:CDS:2, partial [Entrophospora sp. SA101]